MKRKIFMAIIVSVAVLSSCGTKKEQVEETSQYVESFDPNEVLETEAPDEEEVEDEDHTGQSRSNLTGEWKDDKIVNRRSIAVMIPNNTPALPQYGISKASIIYEAPVEGRISRIMGVFEDYDDLERIGPIRSSRDYYIYEAMAFDSIYVNWGLAVPYVQDLINSDRVDNVSQAVTGISKPASEAFGRVNRGSGYSTEFTGYLFIDGLNKAIDRLGYQTEYHDTFVKAFKFADKSNKETYESLPDAKMIYPGGKSGSNSSGYGIAHPYFEYNEDENLYYRYQYGGPQKDEYNDEQVTVSNVIFKICHGEVRDDHDYLAFRVHGDGDCYVFTGGKVIKGTWNRESDYAPNLFYDEDGNEIELNPGRTWIVNIWKEYEEYVDYE